MNRPRAFTIIELLVVVAIIALLVGILLPAIAKAREQAKTSLSLANLRNLATAHQSYAAEWGDRQYTVVADNISTYGSHTGVAFDAFGEAHGSAGGREDPGNHPPTYLGYGFNTRESRYRLMAYRCTRGQVANASLTLPIVFDGPANMQYFGSFRIPNAQQFANHVSGRFYDKVFYAPKDTAVWEAAAPCFDSPDQYCTQADVSQHNGDTPAWSSYCTSPAGMYNPAVLAHDDPNDPAYNGFRDPWTISAGFRSPAFSQALYPALKTHVLEHHWLQNNPVAQCNPGIVPGTYGNPGCEPYYFNHAWESSPATLFYDGHVETLGTRRTMRADGRMRTQTGHANWGLWSRDTTFGVNGYLTPFAYDMAATSYHVLTTDGIRGRDLTTD